MLSRALDRAAYHVACDEQATEHYQEQVSRLHCLRIWLSGFIEGLFKR